jgi:hypothetical protein
VRPCVLLNNFSAFEANFHPHVSENVARKLPIIFSRQFILRSFQKVVCTLSSGRMTDEWWIAKDLKARSSGLIDVLSQRFSEVTENNHEIPQSEWPVSQTWIEHLQNLCQERYHYSKPLGPDYFWKAVTPCILIFTAVSHGPLSSISLKMEKITVFGDLKPCS